MNKRYRVTIALVLAALLAGGSAMAQVTVRGNVYGGGNAADVCINTSVSISAGTVEGNVYGGGNLGDVGTINDKSDKANYTWTGTDNQPNSSGGANNTGVSSVHITGSTALIGLSGDNVTANKDHGNVFGGGKGDDNSGFYCEKGMVYSTSVEITAGTVKGAVFGGGEVGRVEDNTIVEIGVAGASIKGEEDSNTPVINGDVFGAGKGLKTHGYSALVRGNPVVTIQGKTLVGGSVYGGGEIASVGKHKVKTSNSPRTPEDAPADLPVGMPYTLANTNLGKCTVTIKDNVTITNNVFGAGQGIDDYAYDEDFKRMGMNGWDEPFADADAYHVFLQTLALATDTHVTLEGNANVNGSVFGGSESGFVQYDTNVTIKGGVIGTQSNNTTGNVYGGGRGLTNNIIAGRVNGNINVNILGGAITRDVYGGAALAKSNAKPTTTTGDNPTTTYPTTTVNLLGGTIGGDAYGGGLGDATTAADVGNSKVNLNGMSVSEYNANSTLFDSYVIATDNDTPANGTDYYMVRTNNIKGCIVNRIFGANNVNGTPLGDITVHVYATQNSLESKTNVGAKLVMDDVSLDQGQSEADDDYLARLKAILRDKIAIAKAFNDIDVSSYGDTFFEGTTASTFKTAIEALNTSLDAKAATEAGQTAINAVRYDVEAVYGCGNEAAYIPTRTWNGTTGSKAQVIIDGCDYTSIEYVYGGGNAAAAPETNVTVNAAYEIYNVFGGGNGRDPLSSGADNPGADVGVYKNASNQEVRYGTGNTTTRLIGGTIHEAYGASNTKGNIKGTADIDTGTGGYCTLILSKMVGAGKNADIDGNVNLILGCKPASKIAEIYGGADNANVNGSVSLTVTSGNYGKVFGGNNLGGIIKGSITLNIEETGDCDTPIRIDELYLGGNQAAYSIYGYYKDSNNKWQPRTSANDDNTPVKVHETDPDYSEQNPFVPYGNPVLNIISCTSIGKVFGGGLGAGAIMYANPTVNINMIPGSQAATALGNANNLGTIGDVFGGGNQAKVEGNTTVNIGTETKIDYMNTEPAHLGTLGTDYQYNSTTKKYYNITVSGANITGNVYGGGNLADVTGNTYVNICAKYDEDEEEWTSVAEGTQHVTIGSANDNDEDHGHVFGGGKGEANNFKCDAAMVGTEDAGMVAGYLYGNTNVNIGNGTIYGNVYGGGKVGRVEMNTTVKIGIGIGTGVSSTATSTPVIEGSVFGAGQGVDTHGYSGLARGNSRVTVEGDAWVKGSIYGGGEKASVGRYWVKGAPGANDAPTDLPDGMPYALKDPNSGKCYVTIQGHAKIGPATLTMPTFLGNVFGGCKGILPGAYSYADNANKPKRWVGTDWSYFVDEPAYIQFIRTLALNNETHVTIGDANNSNSNPFIKGSVYGGSENGGVMADTYVTIVGGQIGCGNNNLTQPYDATIWAANYTPTDDYDLECSHWPYGLDTDNDANHKKDLFAPYDKFATENGSYDYTDIALPSTEQQLTSSAGGRPASLASDGHTFYGNVFGGGSGKDPYKPGKWLMTAGGVGGNTNVTITGGHILTNVYGGNELTDVKGTCTVNFGGTATLGVPRTLDQIEAHPLTCYLFGAGKGDQRVLFNKETNVKDVVVNITGGWIYGSVFGGGEDGHVLRDVTMTINASDHTTNSSNTETKIGTWGTSYVDGNVFGGGRGFGADAYTAGNIGGSVDMTISGGTMLGSIYGGGRLGSVGYGLYDATEDGYGEMRDDDEYDDDENPLSEGNAEDFFTNGRGHVNITISGGTIGNTHEYTYIAPTETGTALTTAKANMPKTSHDSNNKLTHTKGGNVFAGGMGRRFKLDGTTEIDDIDWKKLGNVKSTKLTISGNAIIKSNVYGGGELGAVVGNHNVLDDDDEPIVINQQNVVAGTEIIITGGTIGTEIGAGNTKYYFGSVYGGGMGELYEEGTGNNVTLALGGGDVEDSTKVSMSGGTVYASVYGGGELAQVDGNTNVAINGGTIGHTSIKKGGATMGNVYGGGKGSLTKWDAGLIKGNTKVTIDQAQGKTTTIYHNIYGGGAYGSVGTITRADAGASYVPGKTSNVLNMPTEWEREDEENDTKKNTGTAGVYIYGGTIGSDGDENGMIFGSSRGDVTTPGSDNVDPNDRLAWVYNTEVVIGGDGKSPTIKGSVYGSGENGHVFTNTDVMIHSGTVGVNDGESITDPTDNVAYVGANYPKRGNVYGGGCGEDTYPGTTNFNPLAGIVLGNTNVTMDGGHVVHNIYGAGALGSVGSGTLGGKTTINISGGRVGAAGTNTGVTVGEGNGNIYGAARGKLGLTQAHIAQVRETDVNIQYASTPTSDNSDKDEELIAGSVYGGGEAGIVKEDVSVEVSGGLVLHDVYGGGALADTQTSNWDASAYSGAGDWADATTSAFHTTSVTMSGGQVSNLYGGGLGRVAATGVTAIPAKVYGNVTVTTTDGTATNVFGCNNVNGTPEGTVAVNINGGTISNNVYGGGNVANYTGTGGINVTMSDGEVNTVFGGGNLANVTGNTTVSITSGTLNGTAYGNVRGAVFGGGYGETTLVTGNVTVNIGTRTGTTTHNDQTDEDETTYTYGGNADITGDVYGGSAKGKVNTTNGTSVTSSTTTTHVNLYGGTISGSLYGGGLGEDNDGTASDHAADVWGPVTVTTYGGKAANVYGGNNILGAPQGTVAVNINGTATPGQNETYAIGNVFGGGNQAAYTYADATHPLTVTMSGGTVNNIYGGGNLADVTGSVTVTVNGGTVVNDVYGGGALANTNIGNVASGYGTSSETINATNTYTTTVSLIGGTVGNAYGGALGAANPAYVYGDVTVTVGESNYSTNVTEFTREIETTDMSDRPNTIRGRVFGANNINGTPKGNINVTVWRTIRYNSDGTPANKPEKTSNYYELEGVYGGGNQANYEPVSGKATQVNIHGCDYSNIKAVYGGGNAASVPASNVTIFGSHKIGTVFGGGNGSERVKTSTNPITWDDSNGADVIGLAKVTLKGGTIDDVFGGSNTKGSCGSTLIDDENTEGNDGCELHVANMYGAGKSADVIGDVDITITGCNTNDGVNVYAGSYNAKIAGKITLTITGGVLGDVFGGNNQGGSIGGPIVVNVEETDNCKPIKINNLYGGGNNAAYPGPNARTYKGNNMPIEDDESYTSYTRGSITLNIKACSWIGNIYGGGKGESAITTGDTEVNINMAKGHWAGYHYPLTSTEESTLIPNTIGTIGNVYGGGDAGNVDGNTIVNIGTASTINFITEPSHLGNNAYTHNTTTGLYEGVAVLGANITGDVYGGGKLANVTGNTEVIICAVKGTEIKENNNVSYKPKRYNFTGVTFAQGAPGVTIGGNVFGGGEGSDDTYQCEKAMVGTEGAGYDNTNNVVNTNYANGNTSVVIGNGTVNGDVFGGGKIARVEANTEVKIGVESGTSAPDIKGDVFGAGQGVITHGFSGLVRGNSTVIVQSSAKVESSVYGGGEVATVGRYWVKGAPGANDAPTDLPSGMPYKTKGGGECTVNILGRAQIGPDNANSVSADAGHVFGAGKGVEPNYSPYNAQDLEHSSRRMADTGEWEYFTDDSNEVPAATRKTGNEKYLEFLQTLALGTNAYVTIDGTNVKVKGSVYGGSRSGFVQENTNVQIQNGTIGVAGSSADYGHVFGGGKGVEGFDKAGRVRGNTTLAISGANITRNVYGGGELGLVGKYSTTDHKEYTWATIKNLTGNDITTGLCTVTINGDTTIVKGKVFGAGKGDDDTFECEQAMVRETNVTISAGTVNGNVYGGGEVGRVDQNTKLILGSEDGSSGGAAAPNILGNVFGAGQGVETHGYSGLVRGSTDVTLQGNTTVAQSVYGGGETAAVGRYGLDEQNMPSKLVSGGECKVTIKGYTQIGENLFGAGKGVNPMDAAHNYIDFTKTEYNYLPKRMTLKPSTMPTIYENVGDGSKYIWEYYTSQDKYFTFLQTLALATDAKVSIEGHAKVTGNIYGGSESGFVQRDNMVLIQSDRTDHTAANVFGGGKGVRGFDAAGRTRGNTSVAISKGIITENVYGGGELGFVGKFTTSEDGRTYTWYNIRGIDDAANATTYTTGLCDVTISGGTVKGNVFGAGEGEALTFKCEPALVRATNVTISDGTVNGNVYGGGEVGRVDQNSVVTIGLEADGSTTYYDKTTAEGVDTYSGSVPTAGTNVEGKYIRSGVKTSYVYTLIEDGDKPIIKGNVFGAGQGVNTHGYSGLVRGNTTVTIQGETNVQKNVYGGGEIAAVGKYLLDSHNMPYSLVEDNLGICTVTIKGNSVIGPDGTATATATTGHVFGAGMGQKPQFDKTNQDKAQRSRRMTLYNATDFPANAMISATTGTATATTPNQSTWEYYNENVTPKLVWEYFQEESAYRTFLETLALATQTVVTIDGDAKVKGNVYGGSESGFVQHNVSVTVQDGEIGTSGSYGNVFGSGKGVEGFDVAGRVSGDVIVNINDGTIHGTVYGGGELGIVKEDVTVNILGGTIDKDVYGGGALAHTNTGNWDDDKYVALTTGLTVGSTPVTGYYTRTGGSGTTADPYTYTEITSTSEKATSGTTYYYKGDWATDMHTAASENAKPTTTYKTIVNLLGGEIKGNAYGGGLGQVEYGTSDQSGYLPAIEAMVYGDVTVNLNGLEKAYYDANTYTDTNTNTSTNAYRSIVALIDPDDTNSDYMVPSSDPGAIVKQIFGGNNLNGTPKGHVKVHVFATQNSDPSQGTIADKLSHPRQGETGHEGETLAEYLSRLTTAYKDVESVKTLIQTAETANTAYNELVEEEDATEEQINTAKATLDAAVEAINRELGKSYDVQAVYGGGNLSAYEPAGDRNTTDSTEVIIDGCQLTSIYQVYAGGNAASAPATYVRVNGTFEVFEVFGGGNGATDITINNTTKKNPGANVGYYDYSTYDNNGNVIEKDDANTKEKRRANYRYGLGVARTEIMGGTIHAVYGGSNQKGNIQSTAVSAYEEEAAICPMHVDETYGAGKNAPIDGDVKVNMSCASGIEEIFGGAKDAPVNSDIVLRITNGSSLKRVFGGNNTSGTVNGSITVIIEEGGCEPIHIGELYAGGYLADYSVYGYNADNSVKTSGNKLYKDPVINVISASRIDSIFGGGYKATVVGNPHVNVNMTNGKVLAQYMSKFVDGFTNEHKDSKGILLYQGDHIENNGTGDGILKVGTIGNIYGGGNMADIIGDTHVEIGTGEWLNENREREMLGITTNITTPTLFTYKKPTEQATSEVWTYVSGGTAESPVISSLAENVTPTPARNEAKITGNVYGGGKGVADNFTCDKAMVGIVDSDNGSTSVTIGNGTVNGDVFGGGMIGRVEKNTEVTIGLTTGIGEPIIKGNVFGAGEGVNTHGYSGLVRGNSTVTIQGKAKVKSSVYGGGEKATVGKYDVVDGLPTTPTSGGLCTVTVTDDAVIGPDEDMLMTAEGGPNDTGHVFGAGKGVLPYEGYGPDEQPFHWNGTKHLVNNVWDGKTWDDDKKWYNVYNPTQEDANYFNFIKSLGLASNTNVTISGNAFVKGSVYGGSENGFVQADTHVTIAGNCQIGNGYVQMADDGTSLATKRGVHRRYTDAEWTAGHLFVVGDPVFYDITDSENPTLKTTLTDDETALRAAVGSNNYTTSLPECASWPYGEVVGTGDNQKTIYAPWDKYASTETGHEEEYIQATGRTTGLSTEGGRRMASDGHTYYGNVFGGGSGLIPYKPGKWFEPAGVVHGNSTVTITGGHILTSVYGGNEQTDVEGTTTVTMSGGTLGVPRTLKQIEKHPVTCYLFGAGKGDQRIFFNTWTNVKGTNVTITGGRIYGSVFGGGEDGHVLEDAIVNISGTNTLIGTTGTSYVDGNVFGGGRGFSGDAQTAGTVGGNVNLTITGGLMLGSVYGGGRLASVGTQFTDPEDDNYGNFVEDVQQVLYKEGDTDIPEGKQVGDVRTPASNYGHVVINISGGTIGNTVGNKESGNVFGGSMGRLTLLNGKMNPIWPKMAQVKTTTVNIYGNADIKRNVYGGGELGTVRDNAYVTIGGIKTADVDENGYVAINNNPPEGTNCTVGRDVYGGGYGSDDDDTHTIFSVNEKPDENETPTTTNGLAKHTYAFTPMQFAGCVGQNAYVHIVGGRVKKSVYGGGEMASVGIINCRTKEVDAVSSADVVVKEAEGNNSKAMVYSNMKKHSSIKSDGAYYDFGLSWPYEFKYVDGFDGKTHVHISGGRIGLTKAEDESNPFEDKDNGDVYGGGKGLAGDFNEYVFCANVGSAEIHIEYDPDAQATTLDPTTYKTSGDCIAGAVYGGAENGHVMGDTKVTLTNGLIGHSLYGGGSGKGKFDINQLMIGVKPENATSADYYPRKIYSITAGKVFGNTEVEMTGGYVVRNVYGGGNMGSVGKGNYSGGSDDYSAAGYGELPPKVNDADGPLWTTAYTEQNQNKDFPWHFLNTGKCTVKITGGTIGYIDSDPNKSMYPLDDDKNIISASLPYGNVFGGCRGVSAPNIGESPRYLYCPESFMGFVNETEVTIGTKNDATAGPRIYGSVYGGGQDGHVRRDASVTVNSGEIGMAYTSTNRQSLKTLVLNSEVPSTAQHIATSVDDISDLDNLQWLARGNVYGAGSGIGNYQYDFNYDGDYEDEVPYTNPQTGRSSTVKETDFSTSAGSVTRFTTVTINGGKIHRNVYGGGSMASVGAPKIPVNGVLPPDPYRKGDTADGHSIGKQSLNQVNIAGTIGTPEDYQAHYGGEVYGASRGIDANNTSQATSIWTEVNLLPGARVMNNVFGGGDNGMVKQDAEVNVGTPLGVSLKSIDFKKAGGTTAITVTTKEAWTTTKSEAGWLTVSPASGTGNGTVTVTADENETGAERQATITITGGGQTKTIAVTQAGGS